MTAADPRDGLLELPECFTSVYIAGGNHAVYSNGQMHEMYRRGKADALAHARPEAVDEVALTKLGPNEKRCETCGRAVWNGVEPRIGWWAPCGNLVARIEDCGKFPVCMEPLTPERAP